MGLLNLWRWTKRIVTSETGGYPEPVPIGLERNPDATVELGAENPPDVHLYMLRVGMRSGFGHSEAGLPVYRRVNPSPHPILKEIYFCEVAGQTLEAANVFALRAKVQQALEAIAPAHSLPLGYFRAARFDYSLPVYEEGSRLICPVLTGPSIKGRELADLREPVTRWLRSAGYLADQEEPEIEVVRPSDLRLVPPAALIRSVDDQEIWMPTVEGSSPDGPVIGLLAHPAVLHVPQRRLAGSDEAPPPSATDITGLLRYLGGELAVRGHVLNPWSLYASDLRPEIWARTEEVTDPTNRRLQCFIETGRQAGAELRLPIRHTAAGEVCAALQEQGITVFLAGDDDALASTVGRYLSAAGFLRHVEDIRLETEERAPAESLDPDAIRTDDATERSQPAPRATSNEQLEATEDFPSTTTHHEEASKT
jgi:hypothetical protein